MPAKDVPVPSTEFTLEELDNELLLYHPTKTTAVYMSETASLVWRLCDGKRTVRDIVEQLKEAYPEASDQLENDVEETLKTFAEHGAVKIQ